MNSRFYMVKDHKDLLSGNIIPRKVLKTMPYGSLGPIAPVVPLGYPVVAKPITKSKELVISPVSPISPVFGRIPAVFGTTSVGSVLSPASPVAVRKSIHPVGYGYSPFLGPPIYKLGRLAREGKRASVVIKSDKEKYSIEVPLKHLRSVVDYIYEHTKNPASTPTPTTGTSGTPASTTPAAKVTFTIVTPYHPDFTVETTADNMVKIIDQLKVKYVGLAYVNPQGMRYPLSILLQRLRDYYHTRGFYF